MTVKITTFTTHSTTYLPSKNHVLHPVFCKTPLQKHTFAPDKKNRERQFTPRDDQLVEGVDSGGVVGGSGAGGASVATA
jgi:hypothetical protein